MDRIVFFGDSICFGFGDDQGGWVGRLEKTKPETHFYNLGVSGQTMAEISARALNEFDARARADLQMGIVLAGGLNDLSTYMDGTRRTEHSDLVRTIETLIANLKSKAPLLVIGPPPIDERMNPADNASVGTQVNYLNSLITEINASYAEICERENIPFLDLLPTLSQSQNFAKSLEDGDYIHPAPLGYAEMAERISNWLPWHKFGA